MPRGCVAPPRPPTWRVGLRVLLALLVGLAGCGRPAQRLDDDLRRSGEFLAAADWDRAGLEARNALQIDPRNARAWWLLAQVAEARQDLPQAFAAYQKAAEFDPASVEAALGLARLLLIGGDEPQASVRIDDVLARQPAHPGARTLRAALLARRGATDDAIALARAVVAAQSPPPTEATLLLAGLLLQQGDRAQALVVLKTALAQQPTQVALLAAAARIASGDPAHAVEAVDDFRRATMAAPGQTELWLQWAALHEARGELDAARAVLAAACRSRPQDDQRVIAQLAFASRHDDAASAEAGYEAAIDRRPRAWLLRFGLADHFDAHQRPEQARAALEAIVEREPEAPAANEARVRLAGRALVANALDDAARWLAAALQRNPRDDQALVLRARLRLRQGRAADAVTDLRAAWRDQPESAEVVGLLAAAHHAAGEPLLARDVLTDAVRARPADISLRLLLAGDMADQHEFDRAGQELEETLRRAPRDPRVLDARVRLALSRDDLAGAERASRAFVDALPDSGAAYMARASVALRRQGLAAARAVFAQAERDHPGVPAIALAREEFLRRSGEIRPGEAPAAVQ